MNAALPLLRPSRPLGAELAELQRQFGHRPSTLREIMAALAGRAYELLMMALVLPFLLPVSVPGMSTPLGLVIAGVAAQLALGRLPWLPRRLLDRRLPAGFLEKVIRVTKRIVAYLERVLRPRWPVLTSNRGLVAVHLAMICVAALALALPMPVPLTNTFPGWTILLLAAGVMERDGVCIAAGYAMMLATTVWFFLLGTAIQQTFNAAFPWLAG
jgi:hypothetical protein